MLRHGLLRPARRHTLGAMSPPSVRSTFTTIGVPIDSVGLGRAEPHGTELSPDALRTAGLGRLGWEDRGDLDVRIPDHERDVTTGLVGLDGVLATTDGVRRAVADLVREGARPFVLGGCCTLLTGALAGARDVLGTLGLFYVDGHLDFYDGVTSPTGEAADMPIAVLLGDGPGPWVERVAPVPVAPASAIAILGYHDPDELADLEGQLAVHRAAGLFDADVAAIRRVGPAATATAALDHVRLSSDRVWMHIDLDVLDQAVFPATDYLMAGGLDWDELVEMLRPVAADPGLVGWSISCYNPEKDPDGADGRAIVAAIERLFG
jgi:arginase